MRTARLTRLSHGVLPGEFGNAPQGPAMARRTFVAALTIGGAAALLAGCERSPGWAGTDVSGSLPPLAFSMTRASDGREATAKDYLGKVVLLYFGYTFCPDVCPTTLLNLSLVLKKLGRRADRVRILFVTVDPNRDALDVLEQYSRAFAPEVVGLRGTADQIAALARRYRVAYSVTPSPNPADYVVTHSAAVYVFDAGGGARLLFEGLSAPNADLTGFAGDLDRLIG